MIYKGRIRDGMVVLDEEIQLPEGTEVSVQPIESQTDTEADKNLPTLYERMKPFIGAVKGLPADFAENHDHYIHGTPKNK